MDDYAPDSYAYLPEFQERILGLLVQDPTWLRGFRQVVDAAFFESFIHRDIASIVLQHFDKFRRAPDQLETAELLDAWLATHRERHAHIPQYVELLQRLWSLELGTREMVGQKAVEFGQHQAVKAALIKGFPLLGEQKYGEIRDMLRKALEVGEGTSRRPLRFGARYEAAIDADSRATRSPVSTGIAVLDRKLGGGLGIGELGVIGGDTGIGKSFLLLGLCVGAALAGKHAFYASLELEDWQTEDRLVRMLCRQPRLWIDEHREAAKQRITEILALTKGDISYCRFPAVTTSLQRIHDAVDQAEQDCGRHASLLVYDYLDKCKPPREREKGHEELYELYDTACGLAGEERRAAWTGSQINSEGAKAVVVRHNHAYGGRAKIHPASIVLGISQTAEEEKTTPWPTIRLFCSKNRNDRAKFTETFFIDYGRGVLIPKEERDGGSDG